MKKITKDKIQLLTEEIIEGTPLFIVDITVKPDMKIYVNIDSKENLTVEDCKKVSRFVESQLNRDECDFQLEVSSPGLGNPFKVKQQYYKAVNKQLEVLTNDDKKINGILTSVTDDEITLEIKSTKKNTGNTSINIPFNTIKKTNYLISFK